MSELAAKLRALKSGHTIFMRELRTLEAAADALDAKDKRIAELEADGWQPTHRHVKRGTEYVLIGIGKMQAESWIDEGRMAPVDMREVAIYHSIDDGSLWARPHEEFKDGRFEPLPAPPSRSHKDEQNG